MKKFIILILSVSIIAALLAVVVTVAPILNYTHKLSDFGVSIQLQGLYEEDQPLTDTLLLSMKREEKGINITAVDLGKDFWSGNSADERMEEYMQVISVANYGAGIGNIEKEILQVNDKAMGKVKYDTEVGDMVLTTIALLTENENGNLAIEIYGTQKNIQDNMDEVNAIISTIKIGTNRHIYKDKVIDMGEDYEEEDKSGESISEIESGEIIEEAKSGESIREIESGEIIEDVKSDDILGIID